MMATAPWNQWPDLSDVLNSGKENTKPSLPLSKLTLSNKAKAESLVFRQASVSG